jgi:C1A family cysteine protease
MGWIPDLPSPSDRMKFMAPPPGGLPDHVDLRKKHEFSIYNQLSLGSCVSQAVSALIRFRQAVLGIPNPIQPSRLAVYYHARFLENAVQQDSGCMIRDAIQSLRNWGFFGEELWPYNITRFRNRPPLTTYSVSAKLRVADYYKVQQTHDQIAAHLVAGEPVVLGFSVYENMETESVARTGLVPMPGGKQLGGHAIALWGYDDAAKVYLFRNSWSEKWGIGGYGMLPFDFVHNPNLSSDLWSIRFVPSLAA